MTLTFVLFWLLTRSGDDTLNTDCPTVSR